MSKKDDQNEEFFNGLKEKTKKEDEEKQEANEKLKDKVKGKKDKAKSEDVDGESDGASESDGTSASASDVKSDSESERDDSFILKSKGIKEQKTKKTYYFYPTQLRKVRELSERSGRDMSDIIRTSIDYFYEHVEVRD